MAEIWVNMAKIFQSIALLNIYNTQIVFQIELRQIKLSYHPDYKWIIN